MVTVVVLVIVVVVFLSDGQGKNLTVSSVLNHDKFDNNVSLSD